MFERSSSRDVSLGKKIAAEILVRMSITESSGFHDLLSLSRVNDPPFFFFSSRQARRGVCFVAALSTTVAKATPLPRWTFRARFHPFVAWIPLVHTRDVAVFVCVCVRISVGTTHEGENTMLKIRLERRSSSRIDESSF